MECWCQGIYVQRIPFPSHLVGLELTLHTTHHFHLTGKPQYISLSNDSSGMSWDERSSRFTHKMSGFLCFFIFISLWGVMWETVIAPQNTPPEWNIPSYLHPRCSEVRLKAGIGFLSVLPKFSGTSRMERRREGERSTCNLLWVREKMKDKGSPVAPLRTTRFYSWYNLPYTCIFLWI